MAIILLLIFAADPCPDGKITTQAVDLAVDDPAFITSRVFVCGPDSFVNGFRDGFE